TPQVSLTLELQFSCSELLDHAQLTLRATSDSTERTPQDNEVQISVPVRYEPDLFLSSDTDLRRYELQPLDTSSPEFSTTVQVHNLGCYPTHNVTLHLALPALGPRGAPLLSLTQLL
ncbi:ITA10 protein, partial [Sitta europaea]|nr:ITA10 protein [Sitta europaea]